MNPDSPEQLLDAFKAAALSVTRLYKTSASAQTKARADGYQDCLDDLLGFLDRENIGLGDGEGWKIRRWATERLDGRDAAMQQALESEDDADKAETASSPELSKPTLAASYSSLSRTDSAPPSSTTTTATQQHHHHPTTITATASGTSTGSTTPPEDPQATTTRMTVPSQDAFTFQSSIPYPQEPNLNLASLDLSDSRPQDSGSGGGAAASHTATNASASAPVTRPSSRRQNGNGGRPGSKNPPGRLGKGAGQKRRMGDDLADIFNIGSLGYGKDFFGGGKRSRHT